MPHARPFTLVLLALTLGLSACAGSFDGTGRDSGKFGPGSPVTRGTGR